MGAIIKTTILDDDSNRIREVLTLGDYPKNASLSIETNNLTLTISPADWNAWLALLRPGVVTVTVRVGEPSSGVFTHTIAEIHWPTWWPRD